MSIVYRHDQARGTTYVLWDGIVTANEFLTHVRKLVADPRWPLEARRHLSDLRTASVEASIDEAVLKQAADLFGVHPKIGVVRAAIVAGDAFVKAGQFERLIARYRPFVFVFNSLNPACRWLGIDREEVEDTLQTLRTGARSS